MRVRVLAVGSRVPGWVRAGVEEYAARLGPTLRLSVVDVAPGTRRPGLPPGRAIAEEGRRILAALRPAEYAVALDERGHAFTTLELAGWLARRLQSGEDLALCIGGPDGHAPEVLARCALRWSLSPLTFPHALVRVLLVEQLYRAQSVLAGHPYHRE
ncbi:MAG: 23S rRNA (pseudouridine(1915)-N(3))-methyltransferase RlmH [Gammaproteobacteria bacterium]|nr:23S rRNA (pseudouridine(1915)-N(3))-methyltransferase RlmH [Gammaproteobacteria bacterium]